MARGSGDRRGPIESGRAGRGGPFTVEVDEGPATCDQRRRSHLPITTATADGEGNRRRYGLRSRDGHRAGAARRRARPRDGELDRQQGRRKSPGFRRNPLVQFAVEIREGSPAADVPITDINRDGSRRRDGPRSRILGAHAPPIFLELLAVVLDLGEEVIGGSSRSTSSSTPWRNPSGRGFTVAAATGTTTPRRHSADPLREFGLFPDGRS